MAVKERDNHRMLSANNRSKIQMRSGPHLPGVGNFMPIGQMITVIFAEENRPSSAATATKNLSQSSI